MSLTNEWQKWVGRVEAPPWKVVAWCEPAEEKKILLSGYRKRKFDPEERGMAFAQFAMPKVRAFFDHPKSRAMSPVEREEYAGALMCDLAGEFNEMIQRTTKAVVNVPVARYAVCVAVSDASLEFRGVRVPYPQIGQRIAYYPGDGSVVDVEGGRLVSFGAFLAPEEWEPSYTEWWESVQGGFVNQAVVPFGSKILIELAEKDVMTPSGFYLPDTAQEWKADAVVLGVGPASSGFVSTGQRVSVDMNLVTAGGLEHLVDGAVRQFLIPPEAINWKWRDA